MLILGHPTYSTESAADVYCASQQISMIKSISEENLFYESNSNVILKVPIVQGKPNMLYLNSFNEYLNEMSRISAPKRFAANEFENVMAYMLIGTSGSGKTATCFEVGRCNYVLYFDVFDSDFKWFIDTVKDCSKNGNDLERFCT